MFTVIFAVIRWLYNISILCFKLKFNYWLFEVFKLELDFIVDLKGKKLDEAYTYMYLLLEHDHDPVSYETKKSEYFQ